MFTIFSGYCLGDGTRTFLIGCRLIVRVITHLTRRNLSAGRSVCTRTCQWSSVAHSAVIIQNVSFELLRDAFEVSGNNTNRKSDGYAQAKTYSAVIRSTIIIVRHLISVSDVRLPRGSRTPRAASRIIISHPN